MTADLTFVRRDNRMKTSIAVRSVLRSNSFATSTHTICSKIEFIFDLSARSAFAYTYFALESSHTSVHLYIHHLCAAVQQDI